MTTNRVEIFARAFLEHGDVSRAALDAGYAGNNYGYKLLDHPNTGAAIAHALQRAKVEDGALARRALRQIAGEDRFPAAARVTAARTLMEYAGMIGTKADSSSSKDPSDMSADELRTLIARLDKELGDRATPVNAPVSIPAPDDVSDFL